MRFLGKITARLLCVILLAVLLTSCSDARTPSFEIRAVESTGAALSQTAVGLADRELPVGAPIPWNGGLLCRLFTEGDTPNLLFLDSDGSERRLNVHAEDFTASGDGVFYLTGSSDSRRIMYLRSEDSEPECLAEAAGDADLLRFTDGRLIWSESVTNEDGYTVSVRYRSLSPESGEMETIAEASALGGQNRSPSIQNGSLIYAEVDSGAYVFRAVSLSDSEENDFAGILSLE